MPTTLEDLPFDIIAILLKIQSDANPSPQWWSKKNRSRPYSSFSSDNDFDDSTLHESNSDNNYGENDGQHTGGDGDAGVADEDANITDGSSEDQDTICDFCQEDITVCAHVYPSDMRDRTCMIVTRCFGKVLEMQSLSTKDIMNLRLTSKKLHYLLMKPWNDILETSMSGRDGIATVWMSFRGLQSFCASIANQIVGQHFSSLRINTARISRSIVTWNHCSARVFDGETRLLDDPLSWDGVKCGLRKEELGYLDTYERYVEQEWATAAGEDLRLFKEVLSRLPNLRKIYLGTVEIPQDVRVSYPSETYKSGEQCEIFTATLMTIFDALAARPIPLEELAIDRSARSSTRVQLEQAGIWALSIPSPLFANLTSSLATIKRLHLSLSTGEVVYRAPRIRWERSLAPEGFTKAQGSKTLLRFISAMPKLSSMHLVAGYESEFSLRFVRKVLRGLPQTLEELHLSNMVMSVSILAHFLNGHRHQLTELVLSRLYLVDENWNTIFRMMQKFLPRLQRVYLEQLWELHPEFSDKVFFFPPRNYWGPRVRSLGRRIYSIGSASRLRGVYRSGEWDSVIRYDGMIMDDEDRRTKAQSLQDGLQHALTQTKREAVHYGSQDVDDPLPPKVLEYAAHRFGKTVEELSAGPHQ